MKLHGCLICLRNVGNETFSEHSNDAPLLPKFLKFVENYLQISTDKTQKVLTIIGSVKEKQAFCEKCELAVISPICQVYLHLLSTQLRLSWELKQLAQLLDNSKAGVNLNNVSQVQEFRTLLSEKCQIKGTETFPCVTLQRQKLPIPIPRESTLITMNESSDTNCDDSDSNSKQLQAPYSEHQLMYKRETENFYGNEDPDYDYHDDLVEHSDSECSDSSLLERSSSSNLKRDLGNYTNAADRDVQIDVEEHTLKIEIYPDHDSHLSLRSEDNAKEINETTTFNQNRKPEDPLSCPYCTKVFSYKASLNMHISKAHPSFKHRKTPHVSSVNKAKSVNCHICGKLLQNRKYLSSHIASYHPDIEKSNLSWLKCPKCNHKFAFRSRLERHLEKCVGLAIIPPQSRPESYTKGFTCNQCTNAYGTQHELNEHVLNAHKPKFSFTFIAEEYTKRKLKKL